MADSGTSTHLSIGEVLGLLLEEFPDITISKIRFLESQGLIEPERTPSGYRKFFDDDVELLRLILREQREKFLPLRVIKDRLDSGEIERDPTPPRGAANGASGRRGGEADVTQAMVRPPSAVDEPPTAAEPAPASDDTAADAVALPIVDAAAESALTVPTEEEPADDLDAVPAAVTEERPSEATVAKHPAAARPAERHAGERAPAPPSSAADGGAGTSNAHLLPGVLVNRAELCAMASITDAQLAQLEDFGVVARPGANQLYGDDAVEVAAAAGGFLRAGVDARHLRGWRNSVDREVGLYEQLVLPVLRQRNPQARVNVREQLLELDALGGRLRSAMTRAALRRYFET